MQCNGQSINANLRDGLLVCPSVWSVGCWFVRVSYARRCVRKVMAVHSRHCLSAICKGKPKKMVQSRQFFFSSSCSPWPSSHFYYIPAPPLSALTWSRLPLGTIPGTQTEPSTETISSVVPVLYCTVLPAHCTLPLQSNRTNRPDTNKNQAYILVRCSS